MPTKKLGVFIPRQASTRNSAVGAQGVTMKHSFGPRMVESKICRFLTLHELAARHFKTRHFWFFVFFKGLLIASAGCLAFFGFTKTVGVIAIVIAFLEIMSEHCMYGIRGAMHDAVSIDLTSIRNRLKLVRTKLKYLEILGKMKDDEAKAKGWEEDSDEVPSDSNDSFDSIRSQFDQSLSGCKSTIPIELVGPFDNLAARIRCEFDAATGQMIKKKFGKDQNQTELVFGAYSILAAQIRNFPFFPIFLPHNEQRLVNETLKIWRLQIVDKDEPETV